MLYLLLYPLHVTYPPLNVFKYITFRTLVAGLAALTLSLVLGPMLIRRLSALQSYTYGLKVIWKVSESLEFDVAREQYDMRGKDGVTPQSAYCNAKIVTLGAKISW